MGRWGVGCGVERAASISSGLGEGGEAGRGGSASHGKGWGVRRGGEVVGDEVGEGVM